MKSAECVIERINQITRANARTYIPYGQLYKGQAFFALGRLEEVEQALREASQCAEELGSRRIWWKCLASLANVTARLGDQAQVQAYGDKARKITDFIAEYVGSAELRDSFLGMPEVRWLYSGECRIKFF